MEGAGFWARDSAGATGLGPCKPPPPSLRLSLPRVPQSADGLPQPTTALPTDTPAHRTPGRALPHTGPRAHTRTPKCAPTRHARGRHDPGLPRSSRSGGRGRHDVPVALLCEAPRRPQTRERTEKTGSARRGTSLGREKERNPATHHHVHGTGGVAVMSVGERQ